MVVSNFLKNIQAYLVEDAPILTIFFPPANYVAFHYRFWWVIFWYLGIWESSHVSSAILLSHSNEKKSTYLHKYIQNISKSPRDICSKKRGSPWEDHNKMKKISGICPIPDLWCRSDCAIWAAVNYLKWVRGQVLWVQHFPDTSAPTWWNVAWCIGVNVKFWFKLHDFRILYLYFDI